MHVRHLELVDFRSYPRVAVDLVPGPNVLVGANGVGKTNLVEALGFVATLASHRVAADAPLVRAGAETGIVRCAIAHEGRELLVELEIVPGRANRARLGRAPARRARDVLGALRLVLFAPEDLELVRGDPGERRRYLDDLLVARQPRFAAVRADYDRVVKQRNALLRTAYLARRAGGRTGDLSTLDVWDVHLATHGAELLAARLDLVEALRPHLAKAYDAVADGQGDATVAYRGTLGDRPAHPPAGAADRALLATALREALADARGAEVERGTTLVGPHRDDLVLHLGTLPAKGYASHGETWSYALALRLAAYELLRAEGVEPVLALDDVFAELDTGRRTRLAELIGGSGQVIITCAVPEDVPPVLRGARFDVRAGAVTRVD
ncbi:DNA replication and repair protein RecF [Pilimelia terevasa]|uniref:DNA replication and repair protein RecF n=1 Tax=Pilimelia terevasa TaxID=53372 RepID=A0A8J3BVQ3_9ACTN|nr:DNA replication/repair protein RecF [Pilimelia terevasa]GGK41624.1 DNA replication and repair protein RecF [Pilimelia terevasa]